MTINEEYLQSTGLFSKRQEPIQSVNQKLYEEFQPAETLEEKGKKIAKGGKEFVKGFYEENFFMQGVRLAVGDYEHIPYVKPDENYRWYKDTNIPKVYRENYALNFSISQSQEESKLIKERLEKNLNNIHGVGYQLGATLGFFLDPSFLALFKIPKLVSKLPGGMGTGALAGGGLTAGLAHMEENIKDLTDPFRKSESKQHIITAAAFGAMIGGLSKIGKTVDFYTETARGVKMVWNEVQKQAAKEGAKNMGILERGLHPNRGKFKVNLENGNKTPILNTTPRQPLDTKVTTPAYSVKYGKTNKYREDGTYVGASFNRKENIIYFDRDYILKQFPNKPWTKPKIKGVKPLPSNAFKTPEEWETFVMNHEVAHVYYPRKAKETTAAYENRINQIAMNDAKAGLHTDDISFKMDEVKLTAKLSEKNQRYYDEGIFSVDRTKVIDPNDPTKILKDPANLNIPAEGKMSDVIKHIENTILPAPWRIDKVVHGWTPTLRSTNYVDVKGQELAQGILDQSLYLVKHKKGKAINPLGESRSAEVRVKLYEGEGMSIQLAQLEIYQKMITRITGKEFKGIKGELQRSNTYQGFWDRPGRGLPTYTEFDERVFLYLKTGDKTKYVDPYPEVAQAARLHTPFYNKIGQEAKDLKLFEAMLEKDIAAIERVIKKKKTKPDSMPYWNDKLYDLKVLEKIADNFKHRLQYIKTNPLPKNYTGPQLWDAVKVLSKYDELVDYFVQAKNFTKAQAVATVRALSKHNSFKPLSPEVTSGLTELDIRFMSIEDIYGFSSSTRVKKIQLTPVDYNHPLIQSVLVKDTGMLMRYYARSLGGDVALARLSKRLGYGADPTLRTAIQDVLARYEIRIKNAKTDKTKKTLIAEKAEFQENILAQRDLVKGTFGLPENPQGKVATGIRIAKQYQTLSMLTGWTAAVPDVGKLVMKFGFERTFGTIFNSFFRDLKGLKKSMKINYRQSQEIGEALDLFGLSRQQILADVPDAFAMHNRLERITKTVSQFNFQYVNAMSMWNANMKSLASMLWQNEAIRILEKWGKTGRIEERWKMRFARAGIDIKEYKLILNELNRPLGIMPGTKHIKIPQTESWLNQDVVRKWKEAKSYEIPDIIVTPFKGDVPLFMNYQWGGLLFQFKKFIMSATLKTLISPLQERDKGTMLGMLFLVALGSMTDYFNTEYRFDKDWSKKPLGNKIYDAIDRSAVGGIFVDINNSVERLFDNNIGIRPILGINPPYGTSLQTKLGSVLGPSGTTVGNIFKVFYDTVSGEYDYHTARNVRRLLPFQNIFYLDSMFDEIEKGISP